MVEHENGILEMLTTYIRGRLDTELRSPQSMWTRIARVWGFKQVQLLNNLKMLLRVEGWQPKGRLTQDPDQEMVATYEGGVRCYIGIYSTYLWVKILL